MKNPEHLFTPIVPVTTPEVGSQGSASPIQRILLSDEEKTDLLLNVVIGDLR